MSGLLAVIGDAPSARPADAELDALVACYEALRQESERGRLTAAGVGVAAVMSDPDDQTASMERVGASWSAYVGSPFGRIAGGDGEADGRDGQFALVSYRAADQRIEVVSDPFGLQALYIAERNGYSYVSTSALALAKHLRARPDRLAIEVFLRTGPHFGELTHWEGITRLPPATTYVLHRGDSSPARAIYWRPSIDEHVAGMSLPQAARHCVEVSVGALRRRYAAPPACWCDITGGFDSRLGALLLDRAGVGFTTETVGEPSSVDVILGARVAGVAGWPWERSRLPAELADRWRDAAALALAWGDGQMDVAVLAEVLSADRERLPTARTLFSGGGGEHWRDYAWQQEGPFGRRKQSANLRRWVDTRFLHATDLSVFRDDPTGRVRENLIERCRGYTAPFADQPNSVQLDMLYAYKSTGHFGAYLSARRGGMNVELPFYTRQVYTAAFSVSPGLRNFHRLMRYAIRLIDRRVAALPTSTGGPAEPFRPGIAHRFLPYLDNRISGVTRKLTEHLPGPTIGAVKTEESPISVRLRQQLLADFISRTQLQPARMRAGRLYDGPQLARFSSSPAATTSGWSVLGPILTVEMALEATDASLD